MTETKHTAVTIVEKPGVPERMHPLVSGAMALGSLDPATIREMMQLQREWEAGEAKRLYTTALVELKAELPTTIARDKTVDYAANSGRVHYTHTSLAAVMDAVVPVLAKHGFSLAWVPTTTDNGKVKVACRLTHAGGHSEECVLLAAPDVRGGKAEPQAIASTITLLQRYTALSLLGIATADMKEPDDEREDDAEIVDTQRNLKAAARMKNYGKTREDAEKFLGKSVGDWTNADLDKLHAWVKPPEKATKAHGEVIKNSAEFEDVARGIDLAVTEAELARASEYASALKGDERGRAFAMLEARKAKLVSSGKAGR